MLTPQEFEKNDCESESGASDDGTEDKESPDTIPSISWKDYAETLKAYGRKLTEGNKNSIVTTHKDFYIELMNNLKTGGYELIPLDYENQWKKGADVMQSVDQQVNIGCISTILSPGFWVNPVLNLLIESRCVAQIEQGLIAGCLRCCGCTR